MDALTGGQREARTFTITLTGLQMEALDAWSNVTEPEPCYAHEDGEHGNMAECDGYAPEFADALWAAYDVIERGWANASATPMPATLTGPTPLDYHATHHEAIPATIAAILWGDGPDTEWDSDTLDAVADVMTRAGFRPKED